MGPCAADNASPSPSIQNYKANGKCHSVPWIDSPLHVTTSGTKMNDPGSVGALPSVHPSAYKSSQSTTSTVKIWIYLALISIVCVLVSSKVPLGSSVWPDVLNYYSEVTTRYMPVYGYNDARSSEVTTTALLESNGRTDQVQWDKYSLVLRGQRIFLQ